MPSRSILAVDTNLSLKSIAAINSNSGASSRLTLAWRILSPSEVPRMLRRDFLRRTAKGLGAAWLASNSPAATLALQPLPQKVSAHDEVVLGKTGIRTTRLAMGTGTVGFGGSSNQVRLGSSPFTRVIAAERVASFSRFATISARPNMPIAMTTKPMPSASCGKPKL